MGVDSIENSFWIGTLSLFKKIKIVLSLPQRAVEGTRKGFSFRYKKAGIDQETGVAAIVSCSRVGLRWPILGEQSALAHVG